MQVKDNLYVNLKEEAKHPSESFLCKFNPLKAELYPMCHLLALSGANHILHVSGIRVNEVSLVTPKTTERELERRTVRTVSENEKVVPPPPSFSKKRMHALQQNWQAVRHTPHLQP